MTRIRQHLILGLCKILVVCVVCMSLCSCAKNTDIAQTFAMAYSQSVSKKVYDDNLNALTKYLSDELKIKLKQYPEYLEDNKRASAEIVANYETDGGAIIYTDVTISSKTQYTLRFDLDIKGGKIQDCDVEVLYKRPVVYIH